MDLLALIVAIVALIASGVALWLSLRATRAAEAVAEVEKARRAEELADAKAARLSVRTRRDEATRMYHLHVENTGMHVAANLTVEAEDRRHGLMMVTDTGARRVAPGECATFIYSAPRGHASRVIVKWTDGHGAHEDRRDVSG